MLIITRTLIYGIGLPGYSSLIVVLLFFSGMNMLGLGILGEYLGRVFVEVKRRPLYLVRQVTGFNEDGLPAPSSRNRIAVTEQASRVSQTVNTG